MIYQLPEPSPGDPEIGIKLPFSTWNIVVEHLARSPYENVGTIINAMFIQTAATEAVRTLAAQAATEQGMTEAAATPEALN